MACSSSPDNEEITELSPAEKLIQETVAAHGGEFYDQASYQFVFRDKEYRFTNDEDTYIYTMKVQTDSLNMEDKLDNGDFKRTIDGVEQELDQKQIDSYSESLNSVIYFATLPHKLTDEAVNPSLEGTIEIKGKSYEVLGVVFDEEGGGKDHDDQFMYWINSNTNEVDYLAYSYAVNGGGVRFRSAYNKRNVDGIIFQDYINYAAPVGTELVDLPALYEMDSLEEASRILTENVVNLSSSEQ